MANSRSDRWSNPGIDLFLELVQRGDGGVRAGLENAIRDAIRGARLARGDRLPPSRSLARDLGISRGTVQEAYAQLAAEGWIRGRQGSGTVVAIDAPAESRPHPQPAAAARWPHDLRPGRPDATAFPRPLWLRCLKEALRGAPSESLSYVDPEGQRPLRVALAAYLGRARGLRVAPDDVLVTSGFTQGLGILARTLAATGRARVAMENPGMPLHRRVVASAGLEVVPVPVDGDGVCVDRLEAAGGIDAVVLTPNRQHPTGATLHPERRARLLEWARARRAFVVEDDYDGEFRYDRQPLAPLQALDPDTVVYAGTTSKTLVPGVRLGWLVLPPALRSEVVAQKTLTDWHTGALDQLALTVMFSSGDYDRHVRTMRLRYRRRRDALVDAFGRRLPHLQPRGTSAGLNVLVLLPDAETERAALEAARSRGVGIEGLGAGSYHVGGGPAGLIVGYAAAAEHGYGAALEALVDALEQSTA